MKYSMKYLPMSNDIPNEISAMDNEIFIEIPMRNEIFNEISAMQNKIFNEIPTNEQ